ncbi:probable calcium-binding protein CML50 [Amborella trichopoda]|uniref:probable calcium-binding protein CML50 n=1 Tax=Amborella trichopoda TaxID=13333 RepID=UPI0005D3F4F1|nr:probable calcium-binding protein CML50 [Amborella trichopoda]|eukprot:XP_011623999.1 probable calcium-binding protein CML50 [Amborella trichopoda]
MAYYGYSSYEYNEPQQQMERYGGSYNSSMAGKQAPSESPWNSISGSNFPPGTDPKVVKAFQAADVDGNGFIDVMELKRVLSSITQTNFSQRTIRLMISTFTRSNTNRVGPKEFMSVFEGLKTWLVSHPSHP